MQSLRQKIYVSTIIDSFNYGTVMQAVATRDVLSAYGDPVFIDYYRPQWTPEGYRNLKLSGPGNPILKRLKYFLTRPQLERQRRMFRDFIERELPLCDAGPYLHGGEFDSDAVYCVGSDQTWNFEDNEGLDPVYFLVNVPDTCRKIAFSASFGRDVLGAEERDLTKEALSGFDAISVRERARAWRFWNLWGSGALLSKIPSCSAIRCFGEIYRTRSLLSGIPISWFICLMRTRT